MTIARVRGPASSIGKEMRIALFPVVINVISVKRIIMIFNVLEFEISLSFKYWHSSFIYFSLDFHKPFSLLILRSFHKIFSDGLWI